jgi:hypothetical protein
MIRMRRVMSVVDRERRVRAELARDETGVALMSAILFMILLAGMSLVLLSVIVSQIGPSYAAQKGTRTVYAAQGGLQAALGVVRSAAAAPNVTGAVFGAPSKLPCTFTGKIEGSATDAISYRVNIGYYMQDPTGRTDAWLASSANKLPCSTPGGVAQAPLFAYLVSEGTGPSSPGRAADEGNRSVAAIYKFKVTTANVAGGRIYNFTRTECLEAVPTAQSPNSITAGSLIRFRSTANGGCSTNDARQLWIYDDRWQIKLASSVDAGSPLCITGPESGTLPQNMVLRACRDSNDTARFNQLWSWTGGHTWRGQKNPVSAGVSDIYVSRGTATIPYLEVRGSDGGDFAPTAAVGAGAASSGTSQLVNYKEFGRCADVTGGNEYADYMIAYPCKQDPTGTGGYIEWNHKWFHTEATTAAGVVQRITMQLNNNTSSANKRCLVTPEDNSTSRYPVVTGCSSTALTPSPNRQAWTRVNDTGDYRTSYLVLDTYGRCLTADSTDLHDSNWSKLKVLPCTGGLDQKWNAPPADNTATFDGFKELD